MIPHRKVFWIKILRFKTIDNQILQSYKLIKWSFRSGIKC